MVVSHAVLAQAIHSPVEDLVLTLHVHGISPDDAERLPLGSSEELLRILAAPEHELYWVNAVVVLGFIGEARSADRLIALYEGRALDKGDAGRRAHAAVPFALGLIAHRQAGGPALAYLLAETKAQLDELPRAPSGRGADLSHLLVGLAVSGQSSSRSLLENLVRQVHDKAASPLRDIAHLARDALDEAIRMDAVGRAEYFDTRMPARSVPLTRTKGFPAPRQVAALRHVDALYTNAQFDADLAAGTRVLYQRSDACNGADVGCPVSFTRAGSLGTFGSPGDPYNNITTASELDAVLGISSARVKYVSSLGYCSGVNPSVVGCAPIDGTSMVLETGYSGTSLFVHEFGHNVGLGHDDSCALNVMSATLGIADDVVSTAECSAFGGNGVTLTLSLRVTGLGKAIVRPTGASCRGSCSIQVPYLADVTIERQPDAGSTTGGCGGSCSFSMTEAMSRDVSFVSRKSVGAVVEAAAQFYLDDDVHQDGFE